VSTASAESAAAFDRVRQPGCTCTNPVVAVRACQLHPWTTACPWTVQHGAAAGPACRLTTPLQGGAYGLWHHVTVLHAGEWPFAVHGPPPWRHDPKRGRGPTAW
jgi:hypothetical protein